MSERKSRKHVSKRNTKVSNEQKKERRKNNKNSVKISNPPRMSKDNFPGLPAKQIDEKINNLKSNNYSSFDWRKKPEQTPGNIYKKAANGFEILNSYPILPNTPEFPPFR